MLVENALGTYAVAFAGDKTGRPAELD